jgi:hypothetical protein
MGETRAELPFIGDQVVCLSHNQAARSGPRKEARERWGRESSPVEESAGAGGAIVEAASRRVTRLGGVLARRPAADRFAVESSNARTEHQRSEQLWAPVSMNLGPQNCGAVPRANERGAGARIEFKPEGHAKVTITISRQLVEQAKADVCPRLGAGG